MSYEDVFDDDYSAFEEDPNEEEQSELEQTELEDPEDEPQADIMNKYLEGSEKYKQALATMFKKGEIKKDDYYNELIQIEEYQIQLDKQQNQIALTDEGLKLIEEINDQKDTLKKRIGDMTINDYNKEMLKLLRREKEIIADYQVITSKQPKVDKLSNLPLDEKIKELLRRELELVKNVAKANGIILRKPKKGSVNYEVRYEEYQRKVDYVRDNFVIGYKLNKLNPTGIGQLTWVLDSDPAIETFKQLKKVEQQNDLVSTFELSKYSKEKQETYNRRHDQNFIRNEELKKVPMLNSVDEDTIDTINNFLSKYDPEKPSGTKFETLREPFSNRPITNFTRLSLNTNKTELILENNTKKLTIDFTGLSFIPFMTIDKKMAEQTNDITFVYILKRTPELYSVHGSFDEYLLSLKDKLINSLETIENDNLRNSVETKIEEINFFIEKGDYIYPFGGGETRRKNLSRLIDIFSVYQTFSEDKVRKLEADIANSSLNQNGDFDEELSEFLVSKIKFLVSQYPEIVLDFVCNRIKTETLINFEVPKNFPDDFILEDGFESKTSKQKLDLLMNWKPDTSNLDKYKQWYQPGDTIDAMDERMVAAGIFLDYKLLKQIINEATELEFWEKEKSVIDLLDIPPNKDADLWKFRRLNSRRNTLPSMRIFQVSTVQERMETIEKIKIAIVSCKTDEPEKIANITENIIFEKSKTDKEYKMYVNSVIKNIDLFCSSIKQYNKDFYILSRVIDNLDYNDMYNNTIRTVNKELIDKRSINERKLKEQEELRAILNRITVRKKNKPVKLAESITLGSVDTPTERKNATQKISDTLKRCMVSNYDLFSSRIENDILDKTENVQDYRSEINNAVQKIEEVCNDVVSSRVKIEIPMIVSIVEFIVNGGRIDPAKVAKMTRAILIQSNTEFTSLVTVEDTELLYKVYTQYTDEKSKRDISKQEEFETNALMTFFKNAKRISKEQHKVNKIIEDNNTYIKPVILDTKPDYGIKYIYSGGKYILPGKYPPFRGPKGDINYTRDELLELSDIFNIEVTDKDADTYELYKLIFNIINNFKEEANVVFVNHKKSKDYIPKIYTEQVLDVVPKKYYTVRDGKPQFVYKDHFDRLYGVPYSYEDGIPVYATELKELADNRILIIEGPAIFSDTLFGTATKTTFYCLVEYLDHRGAKVSYREGVSEPKVKISYSKDIKTCKEFKTEETCNNPESYSLDGSKCGWLGGICKELDTPSDNNNVWFWEPEDEMFKQRWQNELYKIRIKIIEEIQSKELNERQIRNLINSKTYTVNVEKDKLVADMMKNKILNVQDSMYMLYKSKKQIQNDIEAQIYQARLGNQLLDPEFLKWISNKEKKIIKPLDTTTHIPIEIPVWTVKYIKSYTRKGKKQIAVEQSEPEQSIDKQITYSIIPSYISKTDHSFLKNPYTGFFWYVSKPEYTYTQTGITMETNLLKVSYIPLQMIVPTGEYQGYPLVTRQDIINAMLSTAFSTFTEIDGKLEATTVFGIDNDAKLFCLENNIDPFKLASGSGNLKLETVVEYMSSNVPKITTIEDKIKTSMERAIKQKNIDLLKSLIGQMKRLGDEFKEPELIEVANDEITKIEQTKKDEEKVKVIIDKKKEELQKEAREKQRASEAQIIKQHKKSVHSSSSQKARKLRNQLD